MRYGGERGNINSCAFNKHCAGRQFSASNPPQRKAAKRYQQFADNVSADIDDQDVYDFSPQTFAQTDKVTIARSAIFL